MPEIIIVNDVDNRIEYQEVYNKELDRNAVENKRARLEVLKAQKLDIEKEIAEIEEALEVEERIVAIADAKKEADRLAEEQEANGAVE